MKLNKELVLRKIGSEFIIIDPNGDSINMSNIYSLNETAAYLYEKLATVDHFTIHDCISFLLDEYDVIEEQASKDVQDLIALWEELNLIITD